MSSRTLFIGLHFMPTSPTTIVFQTYDLQSDQQTIESFIFDIKTHAPNAPERFFSKICGIADLTKVKAISFMFIDFHWFSNFEEAYGFRLKCKTFCETNGIFYYFTTASTIQNYCALASTKTMVENGQKVSILELNPLGTITGTTVIRHNGGYHFYETLSAQKLDFTEEWKKKFIGNSNPTKVIFKPGAKNQHILEKLKEVFKDENPVISEDCVINFSKYTADHVLHVMGEKSDPYHFVNHCLNSFRVTLSPGDWNGANGIMYEEDLLIAQTIEDSLPFEESAIVFVDPTKCVKLLTKFPLDYFGRVDLATFKTQKVKVTLKIDIVRFYEFKVEPIPDVPTNLVQELTNMDITTDKKSFSKKAKIVTDKINFFIYVYDSNGTEYMVKDSNGLSKIPIYLAFTEEKPLIGHRAKELYHQKSEFVVLDLIKLCSLDRKHQLTPFWQFKVEKEEDGKMMVTVNTGNGNRRSSVYFLLALVLKHALKIIKDSTGGERMNEFEVEFEGFSANEILKSNFVKAGELINVEIVFGSK